MCIAIYQPKDMVLTDETITNCWKSNSDGAGFAFPYDGKVRIHKGFMSLNKFKKAYRKAIHTLAKDKPMVIHFRIQTHGAVDQPNCHPHRVNDQLAFVHNGILSDVDIVDPTLSDSVHFARMLKELPRDFYTSKTIMKMIESFASGDKLIFMDNEGHYEIVNEKRGTWANGVWFSNTTFRSYLDSSTTSPYEWHRYNTYSGTNQSVYTGAGRRAIGRWDKEKQKVVYDTDKKVPTMSTVPTVLADDLDLEEHYRYQRLNQELDDEARLKEALEKDAEDMMNEVGEDIVEPFCMGCSDIIDSEAEIEFGLCTACALTLIEKAEEEAKECETRAIKNSIAEEAVRVLTGAPDKEKVEKGV